MKNKCSNGLFQGCIRLPLTFDAQACLRKINHIAPSYWGQGGRIDVHQHVNALFLRGYAPAEGNQPIHDRDMLAKLPELYQLIYTQIPASPHRALLAKLCSSGHVKMHRDMGDYFKRTVRLHFVLSTTPKTWMLCQGQLYQMQVGEIWAINNLAMHGVLNLHPLQDRLHMIVDYDPNPALTQLITEADQNLGFFDLAIINQLRVLSGMSKRAPS